MARKRKSRNKVDVVVNPSPKNYVTRGSLHSAVKKGKVSLVKNLLSRGLSVDVSVPSDRTLLHTAIHNGDESMVKILLKYNPELDRMDFLELTPLQLAAKEGHLNIFKLLLAACGSQKKIKNFDIRLLREKIIPLHLATSEGHLKIIKYILNNRLLLQSDFSIICPLHTAILKGHTNCVIEFLKHVDNTIIDRIKEKNYLLESVSRGCVDNKPWVKKRLNSKNPSEDKELKFVKIIDILLDSRIQFDKTNRDPLVLAVCYDLFLIGEKLLKYYIKFHKNYLKDVPILSMAAKNGTVHFINELIKAGADISLNCQGVLPIHNMTRGRNYKILSLLMRAGADINARSETGKMIINYFPFHSNDAFFLYVILKYGFNINTSNRIVIRSRIFVHPALHVVCTACYHHIEYLGVLLDWFLDFNVTNSDGHTPLQYAMFGPFPLSCLRFIIAAMVKMVQTQQKFTLSEKNTKTISKYFLPYYKICTSEFESLKWIKVWGRVTFSELINKPLKKLMEYCRNPELMAAFNSYRIDDFFPQYGIYIKSRMNFALRLLNIHEKSVTTLYKLTHPFELPYIVSHEILSYLNPDELQKLSLM